MANAPVNYDKRESLEPQIWLTPGKRKSAGDSIVHNPCGHWHKLIPVTGCLKYMDVLQASEDCWIGPRMLILGSDGYLYGFISGNDSPTLQRINPDTFEIVASKTFTGAELTLEWVIKPITRETVYTSAAWVYDLQEFNGYLYACVVAITPSTDVLWLVRLNMSTLEIVDKMYLGDTCVGTDGNNYLAIRNNLNLAETRPITGANWDYIWSPFPFTYAYPVPAWASGGHARIPGNYSIIYTSTHIYAYTWSTYFTSVSKFDYNGARVGDNADGGSFNRIQLGNLVMSPDKSMIATIYCSGGYGSDPAYIDIISPTTMDLILTKKLDATWNMGLERSGASVIWHSNGYIYCTWLEDNSTPRIGMTGVAKIDTAGNIVAIYEHELNNLTQGKIIASGQFIFYFQADEGNSVVGGIMKLDLNLNVICVEPFHFISASKAPVIGEPVFQETAIGPLSLATSVSSRMLYFIGKWAGNPRYYTKWYYY